MASPLNGPLETGLRALVILNEVFPQQIDIGRLVLFDYCVLHSGDFDGPSSLHPDLPLRSGELGVKRAAIESGLEVMMRSGLASINTAVDGVVFGATDDAGPFLQLLHSEYSARLTERALWTADRFAELDDESLRSEMKRVVGAWEPEFDGAIAGVIT